MAEEKNVIDILLDEDDNQNVFISDEAGKKIEFEQIALIPLDDDLEKTYCILHPVTKIEGVEDDEAFVFVIGENEEEKYVELVKDQDLVDKVFNEYYKLIKEQQ